MDNRRAFLKKAGILAGTVGAANALPASVLKAMAIQAEPGSSFYDAEHVVFLMQENRSFDHIFGSISGVRGYNDPRPHIQPNNQQVWLQKDDEGYTFAPFHVDINKTKITWQGGLPHSWNDQVAARNNGHYDKWVPAKSAMTLAYYNRNDIPFYYALADAFTVCDHNFCSSLTGTTPNRLFYFTGSVRGHKDSTARAVVNNGQAESRNDVYVDWSTFPELLEDNGVDWRVYQNELWSSRLPDEKDDWLGNYGDNPLEYISRHRVNLSAYFRKNGDKYAKPALSAAEVTARYNALTQKEKNLIDKAFTTNINQPDYLDLVPYTFTNDKGEQETINLPKGDIFHQFRQDVDSGKLPAVSWLVAPQRFSDHTSSPLYGTWYVSEALDILTKNPELFKKTIFVVTYDENDGYFDHIPPFVVPNPKRSDTGKISAGIQFAQEFEASKGSPLGLGFRVPMLIVSPWSKGGYVNSEVFDHTSSLMFLEKWLSKKTGKNIHSENISDWRRNICGDLSSAFRPSTASNNTPKALIRDAVVTNIGNAKNKPQQAWPEPLNHKEIADMQLAPNGLQLQEPGVRPANALPYQMQVDATLNASKTQLEIAFAANAATLSNGLKTSGAPFNMYSPTKYKGVQGKFWAYAVAGGKFVNETIDLADFDNDNYALTIHGPNGFYRQFKGDANSGNLKIVATAEADKNSLSGNVLLLCSNKGKQQIEVIITDNAYGTATKKLQLAPGAATKHIIQTQTSGNWYDISVTQANNSKYVHRYAGKIETGAITTTEPLMGNGKMKK